MKNDIFVFDTKKKGSAFLFRNSKPKIAFERAIKKGKVIVSFKTLNEFNEDFFRPKFDKYISVEERELALGDFKEQVAFMEISETITECRDPKDDKFLELAVSADVSCIVTGDKDLLILHPCLLNRQAFRNIPILNATDFINIF